MICYGDPPYTDIIFLGFAGIVPLKEGVGGVVKTLQRSNSLSRCVFSTLGPLGLSKADPCSVDFDSETPKFRFEFCRGFFGGFSPLTFSKEKAPKKHPKIPRKIHPGICSEKIPSDLCRGLLLTFWGILVHFLPYFARGGIFIFCMGAKFFASLQQFGPSLQKKKNLVDFWVADNGLVEFVGFQGKTLSAPKSRDFCDCDCEFL